MRLQADEEIDYMTGIFQNRNDSCSSSVPGEQWNSCQGKAVLGQGSLNKQMS